jgi:molybdopterin synthase catalytic subunit
MQVQVLFFGVIKELAGKSGERIELREGAKVADVLAYYSAQSAGMKESMSSLAVAVNQEYSGAERILNVDDEVALLPPVSGGQIDDKQMDDEQPPRTYASIVRGAIDTAGVLSGMKRGEDGAAVVFEGIVRNQTRGRRTLYLDYEAYEEMALRQMEALAKQALRQFEVRDAALVHRLGRLQIGETSVLIAVACAHRAAAFDACRWLIDTLKRTVPIWKKEFFEDGAVWADGEPFPADLLPGSSD